MEQFEGHYRRLQGSLAGVAAVNMVPLAEGSRGGEKQPVLLPVLPAWTRMARLAMRTAELSMG